LSSLEVNSFGYVFMAEETYDPPTEALDDMGQGIPYAVYGYGAQIVELVVDTALGTIKLERISCAHDVGRAINPMLVEGQIEGGVAQGIVNAIRHATGAIVRDLPATPDKVLAAINAVREE